MQSNRLKAYSLTAHMNNPYQSSMIHGGCREEAVTLSVAGQAVRLQPGAGPARAHAIQVAAETRARGFIGVGKPGGHYG